MNHKILQIHEPNLQKNKLVCSYTYDDELLTNTITLPVPYESNLDKKILQKLCQWIALTSSFGMFSLDYFDTLQVDFSLTETEVVFFEKLAYLGLGEFRVVNGIRLDTRTRILSPISEKWPQLKVASNNTHPLLLNGGGKDGSVSALILQSTATDFTWFQRGNTKAQQEVVSAWGAPVIISHRSLDEKRKRGPYSGHRPVSAGIAFTAILSAYLNGHDCVIASNEASANDANFIKDGVSINHQYSKSIEFERDIQSLLKDFNVPVSYFSLLRPLHELQIAFIATMLDEHKLASFTSCNNGVKAARWCLACAKCAFVTLILTAAKPEMASYIWGEQVINKPELHEFYIALLDPSIEKPFECVGTLEECRIAARIILLRNDINLTPETKTIFDKFSAKLSVDEMLNHPLVRDLADDAMPESYAKMRPIIQDYIDDWQSRWQQ